MYKVLQTAIVAFTIGTASVTTAGERLTEDEVKSLLVGNTEAGMFNDRGREFAYWEYYRRDGRIEGKDELYGTYVAFYNIRADGCFYGDYDLDQYDGCYYLEHVEGNQYRSTYPDGTSRIVTILSGDPMNLNR